MIVYSRTALSSDTEGNLTRLTTIGPNQNELLTNDINLSEKLDEIIRLMKVMNFNLSTITGNFTDEIGE
jgi:hypothetical protein